MEQQMEQDLIKPSLAQLTTLANLLNMLEQGVRDLRSAVTNNREMAYIRGYLNRLEQEIAEVNQAWQEVHRGS